MFGRRTHCCHSHQNFLFKSKAKTFHAESIWPITSDLATIYFGCYTFARQFAPPPKNLKTSHETTWTSDSATTLPRSQNLDNLGVILGCVTVVGLLLWVLLLEHCQISLPLKMIYFSVSFYPIMRNSCNPPNKSL